MKPFLHILLVALVATAARAQTAPAKIVLENGDLRAEIVPAWAGRLMFFGRVGGENVFWTQPEAADIVDPPGGKRTWKNYGGEKTWVGSQDVGWRAFAGVSEGSVWPPPAWFDADPMQVVGSNATSVVLCTGVHRGGDWEGMMRRTFMLEADRLVVRQQLLPLAAIPVPRPQPLPDDDRRLWSVAQVPRVDRIAMRVVGEGRHIRDGEVPAPVPSETPGWVWINIASMTKSGKLCADGDALAAPLRDGSGWLLIEQTAPEWNLSAFATPGRAMAYASAIDFKPSPYIELEFASYGPDAHQTLSFRIVDTPWPRP